MIKIQLPDTLGTNGVLGLFAEACGGVENPRLHETMSHVLDGTVMIKLPFADVRQLKFFTKEIAHFEDWALATFKKGPKIFIV
jgi:hypothetical protein